MADDGGCRTSRSTAAMAGVPRVPGERNRGARRGRSDRSRHHEHAHCELALDDDELLSADARAAQDSRRAPDVSIRPVCRDVADRVPWSRPRRVAARRGAAGRTVHDCDGGHRGDDRSGRRFDRTHLAARRELLQRPGVRLRTDCIAGPGQGLCGRPRPGAWHREPPVAPPRLGRRLRRLVLAQVHERWPRGGRRCVRARAARRRKGPAAPARVVGTRQGVAFRDGTPTSSLSAGPKAGS